MSLRERRWVPRLRGDDDLAGRIRCASGTLRGVDPVTHAVAGAVLARATAPKTPGPDTLSLRARIVAGTAAAAFPDVDDVLNAISPIVYLEHHRGITHSILLLPAWALLLAWICARVAGDPRGVRPWYGVCLLGLASHVVLDLITSFGTMLLAPFSTHRFALGTTFIIDLWFTGILLAGLAGSLVFRRSRAPAAIASLMLIVYVVGQGILKQEAEAFARRYAEDARFADARVAAHPRPVSPFNWTVFVVSGERIAFAHVNLRRRHAKPTPTPQTGFIATLDAAYRPLDDVRWQTRPVFGEGTQRALAMVAWRAEALAFFRWFADLPALDGIGPEGRCVWFRDLRFETPGRRVTPFRYGVCRDGADGPWRLLDPGDT